MLLFGASVGMDLGRTQVSSTSRYDFAFIGRAGACQGATASLTGSCEIERLSLDSRFSEHRVADVAVLSYQRLYGWTLAEAPWSKRS